MMVGEVYVLGFIEGDFLVKCVLEVVLQRSLFRGRILIPVPVLFRVLYVYLKK